MDTSGFKRVNLDDIEDLSIDELIERANKAINGVIKAGKPTRGTQEYRDMVAQNERERQLAESGAMAYRPGKTRVEI